MFGFGRKQKGDGLPEFSARMYDATVNKNGEIVIQFTKDCYVTQLTQLILKVNIDPIKLQAGPLYSGIAEGVLD